MGAFLFSACTFFNHKVYKSFFYTAEQGSVMRNFERKSNKQPEDDLEIDFSGIKRFLGKLFSKKSQTLIIVLLLLIPIFFAVFFRAYPATLPATDDWAMQNLRSTIQSQVAQTVNQEYPNLPAQSRQAIINKQVEEVLRQNQAQLAEQVSRQSAYFKSRLQDDSGQTYLLAIDPYFYFRFAENLQETGMYGDEIVDGRPYDNHMFAPNGRFANPVLHTYLIVALHAILSIFGAISLMGASFWLPVFLSALAVIPAFFIAKRKAGVFGGFATAMFVAIGAAALSRTAGGFSDTDAYNILFPLVIAWLFLEAFEAASFKKQLFLLLGTGLAFGLYSFAWGGWWYFFDFLAIVIIVYVLFVLVRRYLESKSFKKLWSPSVASALRALGLFIVFGAIFVTLFNDFATFVGALKGPLEFTVIKQAAKPDLWPNVYTTVAELNPASISTIINQAGGVFLFLLGSFGIVLTMTKKEKPSRNDFILLGIGLVWYLILIFTMRTINPLVFLILFLIPPVLGLLFLLKDNRGIDVKYALMLAVWFVGTMYASTKGARFTLLLIPAFAVALGILFGIAKDWLANVAKTVLNMNKNVASIIIVVLLLLLFIQPLQAAHQVAKNEIPSMNDAWWNTLQGIEQQSQPDAIITSWWDFGHWFKAVADRPVTFDGASQNSPQAHWVGKSLLTSNEDESVAILRMLDCGGNDAFNLINAHLDDTEFSVNLINRIIMLTDADAAAVLAEAGLTQKEALAVLEKTHCEPPEAFFITSEDMVGKSGVWGHFGSWNFSKAWMANNLRNKPLQTAISLVEERYALSSSQAQDLYIQLQSLQGDTQVNAWISPWPGFVSVSGNCEEEHSIVTCSFNAGMGQQNGQQVILESAVVNLENLSDTHAVIAGVSQQTGALLGRNNATFAQVTLGKNASTATETAVFTQQRLASFALYLSEQEDGSYKAVIADPLLADSIFAKLFFLEGAQTRHFELFSDTSSVFGQRIIVWKVNWPGE